MLVSTTPAGSACAEFFGRVAVWGSLAKLGGGFRIDHPADPSGQYLNHSFVESDERKNLYDGVVTLDADGTALVPLPAWFEQVNQGVRYQLTSIGVPAPNLHIAEKLSKGRFRIAGGPPKAEICWQLSGVRHDPWAAANPMQVEEPKPEGKRGTFITPALHGATEDAGLSHKRGAHVKPRRQGLVPGRGR